MSEELELDYTGELHYVQDRASTTFKFVGEDCNMVLTTEMPGVDFKLSKISGARIRVIIEIPDSAEEIYSIS